MKPELLRHTPPGTGLLEMRSIVGARMFKTQERPLLKLLRLVSGLLVWALVWTVG